MTTYGVVVVQDVPWPEWRRRVLEVDALGYDSVHVWDHLVHRTIADTDPLLDSFGVLSAAAAITSRVRLGTLVASPTLRHPYLLAKQAMTLDHVSGGRLELGIGAAGVLRDYQALGIEPWPKAEQVERFRETVELVVAVTNGATEFRGRHYSGEQLSIAPGTTQRPLPLTLAAHGPRTLRIAATYASTWNTITARDVEPAEALRLAAERAALLDRYAEEAGRDPATIRRSVLMGSNTWPMRRSARDFLDAVERYRELGFDEFLQMYPDHPAEAALGHGEVAADIVRSVAEAAGLSPRQ
ncbi:MAG TPA: LLM class flavin-dependent oxidoreductase [Frankiaceae bacterium]|nr:LLM class flavin-dependent oxidoreductase [Frankiaceae bacterium]